MIFLQTVRKVLVGILYKMIMCNSSMRRIYVILQQTVYNVSVYKGPLVTGLKISQVILLF